MTLKISLPRWLKGWSERRGYQGTNREKRRGYCREVVHDRSLDEGEYVKYRWVRGDSESSGYGTKDARGEHRI